MAATDTAAATLAEAARKVVAETRAAQGLTPRVTDPAALRKVAALVVAQNEGTVPR